MVPLLLIRMVLSRPKGDEINLRNKEVSEELKSGSIKEEGLQLIFDQEEKKDEDGKKVE